MNATTHQGAETMSIYGSELNLEHWYREHEAERARIDRDSIAIMNAYTMPNQVGVIEVKLQADYEEALERFASLPDAIEYRGRHYGKSSWNSDTMTACYRTDKPLAKVYYVNQ